MVKAERMEDVASKAEKLANERLLDYIAPLPRRERASNPLSALFGPAVADRVGTALAVDEVFFAEHRLSLLWMESGRVTAERSRRRPLDA